MYKLTPLLNIDKIIKLLNFYRYSRRIKKKKKRKKEEDRIGSENAKLEMNYAKLEIIK